MRATCSTCGQPTHRCGICDQEIGALVHAPAAHDFIGDCPICRSGPTGPQGGAPWPYGRAAQVSPVLRGRR